MDFADIITLNSQKYLIILIDLVQTFHVIVDHLIWIHFDVSYFRIPLSFKLFLSWKLVYADLLRIFSNLQFTLDFNVLEQFRIIIQQSRLLIDGDETFLLRVEWNISLVWNRLLTFNFKSLKRYFQLFYVIAVGK